MDRQQLMLIFIAIGIVITAVLLFVPLAIRRTKAIREDKKYCQILIKLGFGTDDAERILDRELFHPCPPVGQALRWVNEALRVVGG